MYRPCDVITANVLDVLYDAQQAKGTKECLTVEKSMNDGHDAGGSHDSQKKKAAQKQLIVGPTNQSQKQKPNLF